MKYLITLCVITLTLLPTKTAFTLPDLTTSKLMDVRAVKLGTYFEKRKCPLMPYIDDFITAADKYDIDYRLLPAISTIESQCGKIYPRKTFNPFGWGSARIGFDSIPTGIDYITGQLKNSRYYAGKTTERKLATYCPNPTYPGRVLKLMNEIDADYQAQ